MIIDGMKYGIERTDVGISLCDVGQNKRMSNSSQRGARLLASDLDVSNRNASHKMSCICNYKLSSSYVKKSKETDKVNCNIYIIWCILSMSVYNQYEIINEAF